MAPYGPAGGLGILEIGAVAAAWLCFALVFVVRTGIFIVQNVTSFFETGSLTGVGRRRLRSLAGLVLQVAGYIVVTAGVRHGSAFLPIGTALAVTVALLAVALLAASVLLAWAALRMLGKQWSLAAQLVEGHELVTSGVYGLVRHPIYTAMLGMLLGTALAVSSWWALLAGTLVFLLGTGLRVRVEERLLLGEFGDAYRDYARQVPALIPLWPRHTAATGRS